jgi:hypothetical protein
MLWCASGLVTGWQVAMSHTRAVRSMLAMTRSERLTERRAHQRLRTDRCRPERPADRERASGPERLAERERTSGPRARADPGRVTGLDSTLAAMQRWNPRGRTL